AMSDTCAPAWANARATDLPTPWLAPVTMATCPVSALIPERDRIRLARGLGSVPGCPLSCCRSTPGAPALESIAGADKRRTCRGGRAQAPARCSRVHGRACSQANDARKIKESLWREPMSCNPTGRPLSVDPARTEGAGLPAKLNGAVKATKP